MHGGVEHGTCHRGEERENDYNPGYFNQHDAFLQDAGNQNL